MKTFKDHPEFKPNLSPHQILKMGAFGGTYFRPIYSSVTKKHYKSEDVIKEYPKSWFKDIDIETTNSTFTNYDDYLYVSEVWEMIAINILDVNDYDLISSDVSANDFLMACKICKKLSSHNKTTDHNLMVAYQKMGRHFENLKQYKSAYKFWKLVGSEKGLNEL